MVVTMASSAKIFKALFRVRNPDVSFIGYLKLTYVKDWRELVRLIIAIYGLLPRKFQAIVYSAGENQMELLIPLPEELYGCIGEEARTHYVPKGKIFYIPTIPAMSIALDDLVSREPVAIIGDVSEKDLDKLDVLKNDSLGLLLVEIIPQQE